MEFGFGKLVTAAGLAVLAGGCADLRLSRFAPPGIIKYEDIASKAPPNPAIQQQLDERPKNDDARFPLIAQTPARPPVRRPKEQQQALSDRLVGARDELEADIKDDREAIAAERASAQLLSERRDRLDEDLAGDERAAARERTGPMPSAGDEPGR